MSCYHPNKAFKVGVKDNGKLDLVLRSYNVDHIEFIKDRDSSKNGKWQNAYNSFISPKASRVVKDYIEVPCGKCLGCRMNYSRNWADRMMLEMQNHNETYFITLTYDDDHVPYNPSYYKSTGEIVNLSDVDENEPVDSVMTLRKKDAQLFLKRLRNQTKQDIMYFCTGEYGEHTSRPHMHLIVFGLHLDDLKFLKRSNLGFNYYTSETVRKAWSKGNKKNRDYFGHVLVAPATWETCAYTARYVTKKADHDLTEVYKSRNIEPEFCTMSKKPAIAKSNFFDYIKDGNVCYARNSSIFVKTEKGGKEIKIPKYWDRLAEQIYPDIVKQKKEDRMYYAQQMHDLKMENTSLSYLDQLQVEEHNLEARLRSLERNKI